MRIFNSQSRQKEEFKPLDPAGRKVGIYACGPTVYDSLHIGHARAYLAPDIVRRYLEYKGFHVRYVTNFTDVDDKILNRAIAENRDWRELTTMYIDEAHRLLLALNIRLADVYPRATDHIPEMIEIVRRLLDAHHAYVAGDGDVYFDTASFARYGALSGRNLEEEDAGLSGRMTEARLRVKRNSGDFVLWKLNRNDKEELARGGERLPHWPSPWGDGRPGWHLECSAMSRKYLGVPFDIHCGGQDLLFPHHEDEKAQTECAYQDDLCGHDSVRYWVHNAFVTVKARPADAQLDGDLVDQQSGAVKMSKSLGNVKWLREMIWPEGPYDPMSVRMLLLSSHYRSPIIFEPAMLSEATAKLDRIYNTLELLERILPPSAKEGGEGKAAQIQAFEAAMDDDFNTAGALAAIFDAVSAVNQLASQPQENGDALQATRLAILAMLNILGLRTQRVQSQGGGKESEQLVELLLQVRKEARTARQFTLSDKVRTGLKALGYEVEDLPDGKWAVKKV
jgi:cysteinyl-tRNA synthetase